MYFHLVRKNIGIKPPWFTKTTDIYFDGYPRTGNTFLSHLLRNVLYNLESVHHLHSVGAIKIALIKKIPCYILVRNPLDAIASNYMKHYSSKKEGLPRQIDTEILNEKLEDYIRYYDYVLKNMNKLNIIEFQDLINNPLKIITNISEDLDESFDPKDFKYALIYYYKDEEELKKIPKDYKSKNKDGGKNTGGAKDKLGSSLPNSFKVKTKKELSHCISQQQRANVAKQIFSDILKEIEIKSRSRV